MAAYDLQLTNIVTVSLSTPQTGVGAYNTSNLALFTTDAYQNSFGTAGYQCYLAPTQVATDFGSSSTTYAMANAVFSQQPNILLPGGYLCVIPLVVDVQTFTPSGTAASGNFKFTYNAASTANIAWNDNAAAIQTKLQAVAGMGQVTVTGSIATVLTVTFWGCYGSQAGLLTVTSNTLQTGGSVSITFTNAQTTTGETINAAITRTENIVQYFGVMGNVIYPQADLLAAAATIQALNKIMFAVSATSADVNTGGMLDLLRSGTFTQTRGLFYGVSTSTALNYMAAYAGRGLSTVFSGSNTTSTMHMKTLAGVNPDTTLTQTILNSCIAAGADVYASFQGVPKVFCSGTNDFYDNQYNAQWLQGALQVAGFNYLATSNTKIPQTENGITGLKAAYRAVMEQGVRNGYLAPGTWTNATTFGNQSDFYDNISQRGYYIYSVPVSQQSSTDRSARKAPLVQIAAKLAGAVHSSAVIVNVNA